MGIRAAYKQRSQMITDGEHNQAVVRLVAVIIGTAYGVYVTWNEPAADLLHLFMVGSLSCSLALWFHVLWSPSASVVRRVLGVIHDTGATTIFLSMCGPNGALYIFVFPWNMIGNGFRYGLRFLGFSALCGSLGMLYLIYFAEMWVEQKVVGFGALISLLLVAAYAAFLLNQRQRDARVRDQVLVGLRDIIKQSDTRQDDSYDVESFTSPKLSSAELLRLTKQVDELVISKQASFRDLEVVFQGNRQLSQSRSWPSLRDSIQSLVHEILLGLPGAKDNAKSEVHVWRQSENSGMYELIDPQTTAVPRRSRHDSQFAVGKVIEVRRDPSAQASGDSLMLIHLPYFDLSPAASAHFERLWLALSPSLVSTVDLIHYISDVREKGRLENELKTAQLVQQTLLPRLPEHIKGLDISSFFESANECGGDWWGFYPMSEGRYLILVGDATGHGTASALVTGILKGFADAATLDPNFNLTRFFHDFNQRLYSTGQGVNCLSLLGLMIDPVAQKLEVMNAGHPPPILMTPQCSVGAADLQVLHTAPGIILGFDPQLPTDAVSTHYPLPARSYLIAYTDGLTEALDETGRLFGEGRVLRLLKKINASSESSSNSEIRETLKTNFVSWLHGHPAQDDTTFLVMDIGDLKIAERKSA